MSGSSSVREEKRPGDRFSSFKVAHAQDQAVISTARELAKEAFLAYDEGRYEEAAEKSRKV